eukprot:UN07472
MGPDDGYPPENYPNYDPYHPKMSQMVPSSPPSLHMLLISVRTKEEKILKKKVRIDDTTGNSTYGGSQ